MRRRLTGRMRGRRGLLLSLRPLCNASGPCHLWRQHWAGSPKRWRGDQRCLGLAFIFLNDDCGYLVLSNPSKAHGCSWIIHSLISWVFKVFPQPLIPALPASGFLAAGKPGSSVCPGSLSVPVLLYRALPLCPVFCSSHQCSNLIIIFLRSNRKLPLPQFLTSFHQEVTFPLLEPHLYHVSVSLFSYIIY